MYVCVQAQIHIDVYMYVYIYICICIRTCICIIYIVGRLSFPTGMNKLRWDWCNVYPGLHDCADLLRALVLPLSEGEMGKACTRPWPTDMVCRSWFCPFNAVFACLRVGHCEGRAVRGEGRGGEGREGG